MVEHHVFEGHEIARRFLDVAHARGEQLLERILAIDRNQPVAQRVVRRVQAHRQRHRACIAQPVEGRDDARGRQRHAPARQPVGVVVEHDVHGGDDVVEVGERLAHAHHHDVGDRMPSLLDPGRGRVVGKQRTVRVPQLADDLGDAEVAVEALLAGRAERAVERAAGLRRDAQACPYSAPERCPRDPRSGIGQRRGCWRPRLGRSHPARRSPPLRGPRSTPRGRPRGYRLPRSRWRRRRRAAICACRLRRWYRARRPARESPRRGRAPGG